jgi:hypothetical protein
MHSVPCLEDNNANFEYCWYLSLFFILYYGAGYVNMLQLLMVAGYTIFLYEHINTQQLISDALASPIRM